MLASTLENAQHLIRRWMCWQADRSCSTEAAGVSIATFNRNCHSKSTVATTTPGAMRARYIRMRENFKSNVRSMRRGHQPLVDQVGARDNVERIEMPAARAVRRNGQRANRSARCRHSKARSPTRRSASSRSESTSHALGRQPTQRPAVCHRTSGPAMPDRDVRIRQ
jgi:hypothetical protein